MAGSLLLVLSGCMDLATETTDPPRPSTTVAPTSTLPPVVDCPGSGEFDEGGGLADIDGTGSDSARLGRITWDARDQCETFLFDFETSEGAPATALPDVQVEHLDSFQVIRVSVGVNTSVLTDQLVESDFVDRLYVVRAVDGEMFVDLHLSAPAAVRVTALNSPARLRLELRPGFVSFTGVAETADDVVLVSPAAGAETATTTDLIGYSRIESNVLVVVTQAGALVYESGVAAADSSDFWGEFEAELRLPPGSVSVFVGEESPEDGSLQGVTIDVNVS